MPEDPVPPPPPSPGTPESLRTGGSTGQSPPRRRRSRIVQARAPGAYLPFPLWLRFALSGVLTVVLLTALVFFVDHHNTDTPPSSNPAAEVQANHEAEILVAQDQAPHVVAALRTRASPLEAARLVIRAFMTRQISIGSLGGPLRRIGCTAAGTARLGRPTFRCSVSAGGVRYEFLGVVDRRARRVTYCKRDPPPAPSDNVAVSSRCRA